MRGERWHGGGRGSAAILGSGDQRRRCCGSLSTTAISTVVVGAPGMDEIDGGLAGYWRATPAKFRRRKAKSRRGRGIGELEEGGEATDVEIGGGIVLLL